MGQQSPAAPPRQPFGLGEWRIVPTLDRISRGNEIVRVPPRVMQVLLCLADDPGQVVTKQQLIDTVWSKEFVTEGALTRCIAILRRFLGDDARQPRYVENIPRRGYRLVMPPQALSETEDTGRAHPGTLCWLSYGERRFVLSDGENLIGRAPDAAVHIDSKEVSRYHARVIVAGVRATVEDLGSKNGTFVEGRRLDTACQLRNGDHLAVGSLLMEFRVHDPQGSTETAHDQ
jgi:DNA-binding winged helix-turn-helix (wHTH) protein